jgi:hypothetical protein
VLVQADPCAEGDEDRQAELAEDNIDEGGAPLADATDPARAAASPAVRSLQAEHAHPPLGHVPGDVQPDTPPPMTIAS